MKPLEKPLLLLVRPGLRSSCGLWDPGQSTHRHTTDMAFKTGVWQQLDDLANKLIMIFWTLIMVTLWSQRFSTTCNYFYSNQKTGNEQFHVICVSALLVPLYGFDLNTVSPCTTQTAPTQGAIATPCPQSILPNSWKIPSCFNYLLGSLLHKSFSRGCASYCQHTEIGSTPEGSRKNRQKAAKKTK